MLATPRCARCKQEAPPEESDAFGDWEALGPDGDQIICPGCITGEEQQAMDEDMMEIAEKVRENRLRRMASRQGLALRKSRRRDPRAYDYGSYWLIDPATNSIAVGDGNLGMNLDQVEEALTAD